MDSEANKTTLSEAYTAPPSALRFMLQALRRSPGWQRRQSFPDLCLTWRGFRIDGDVIRSLQAVAGNTKGASEDSLRVLAPHVSGFRLLMVALSHTSWPLPVWGSLQVRNRLVLHHPFQAGDAFDLVTRVAAWRVLDKGIEVDLHTQLRQGDACAWESVVTIYYRGRFGEPAQHGAAHGAPTNSPVIDGRGTNTAQWRVDGSRRWHFGTMTGDYNGIHQWGPYARRLGFPAAFAHSQRVVAQCLAHLPALDAPVQQLDLWIKGPVFYDREVILRQQTRDAGDGLDFAVSLTDDPRPALVGSWRKALAA
jgi:hypothetical protein